MNDRSGCPGAASCRSPSGCTPAAPGRASNVPDLSAPRAPEVALQVLVEVGHDHPVASRRFAARRCWRRGHGPAGASPRRQIRLNRSPNRWSGSCSAFRLSGRCISPIFMGTFPYCCIGYLCIGLPDRLPPFAMWPALPTSDYYGGSDPSPRASADCSPWHPPTRPPRSRWRTLRRWV